MVAVVCQKRSSSAASQLMELTSDIVIPIGKKVKCDPDCPACQCRYSIQLSEGWAVLFKDSKDRVSCNNISVPCEGYYCSCQFLPPSFPPLTLLKSPREAKWPRAHADLSKVTRRSNVSVDWRTLINSEGVSPPLLQVDILEYGIPYGTQILTSCRVVTS